MGDHSSLKEIAEQFLSHLHPKPLFVNLPEIAHILYAYGLADSSC